MSPNYQSPYNHNIAPNPINPSDYPYVKAAQKRRTWLWGFLLVVFIVVASFFALAVYQEVKGRDAELKNLLALAQQDTANKIIDSELLNGLAGKSNPASSTAETKPTSTVPENIANSPKDKTRLMAEKSGRPQLGNASSSLVIVQFADFQCPTCLAEYPIFRAVTNKYAKDALFIFRNYPVIDQNSMMLAEAGLCAQEQGKFWPLHDRLFTSQGQIADLDSFKQIAVMSGLNWNKLQDCVNKEKYKNQLMEDMSDALDLGVKGTPTFFINGAKLEGAVSAETWDQIFAKAKELQVKN